MVQQRPNNMLEITMSDSGDGFSDAALSFLDGGTMTAQNADGRKGAVIRFCVPGDWVGEINSLGDVLTDWKSLPPVAAPKSA